MKNTFRIAAPGYENRLIGLWRGQQDGSAQSAYDVARDAVRQAEGFALALGRIAADENLSAMGRIEPARQHVAERTRVLQKIAAQVDEHRSGIQARQQAALKIGKADAAEAVLDVAIATYIRSLPDREQFKMIEGLKLGVASQRLVEAVVRLPPELCGMTQTTHAGILSEHVRRADPEAAEELRVAGAAWDNAAEVVKTSLEFVAHIAPASPNGPPAIRGVTETPITWADVSSDGAA